MTPEEHTAWLEQRVRELGESVERISAGLLPVQRLTWEVEKDKEIQMREEYQRISDDYDDLYDDYIDARMVLEKIAALSPGCTPSADMAISLAHDFLKERGRNTNG